MKVCMLVHNPPYHGGIVQYCILLANSIKDKVNLNLIGFKNLYPKFLYKGKLPKKNDSGIQFEIHSENFIAWYNPLTWLKAYFIIKSSDIFHFHWVSPLLAPLQYTILILNQIFSKKPVVITCHNIEPHESTIFDNIFTKAVFSKVDRFIVHASQNKERLIKDYNIKKENIYVIPHGNFSFFTKWSSPKSNKQAILFFGYIRKYKGLIYLIKALPEIIKQNKNINLIIAGELWEDWKIYQDEINKLNLNNHIKVYPYYIPDKEVHKFFNMAEIVVLPYHNTEQTISGPLLVSLAFGKPIIISKVGGIPEIIKNNKNGLLVEPGNVKELSKTVNYLLKNKQLQKKLSKEALKTTKNMTWDKIADKTLEVYKSI